METWLHSAKHIKQARSNVVVVVDFVAQFHLMQDAYATGGHMRIWCPLACMSRIVPRIAMRWQVLKQHVLLWSSGALSAFVVHFPIILEAVSTCICCPFGFGPSLLQSCSSELYSDLSRAACDVRHTLGRTLLCSRVLCACCWGYPVLPLACDDRRTLGCTQLCGRILRAGCWGFPALPLELAGSKALASWCDAGRDVATGESTHTWSRDTRCSQTIGG